MVVEQAVETGKGFWREADEVAGTLTRRDWHDSGPSTVAITEQTPMGQKSDPNVARGLTAPDTPRYDGESENFVISESLTPTEEQDDEVYDGSEPFAFDWQAGGSGDESFRGKSRSYPVRKPGVAGSLQANKVEAVAIPEVEGFSVAEEVAQPLRTNPHNNSDATMEATMHVVTWKGKRYQGTCDHWRARRVLGHAMFVCPCGAIAPDDEKGWFEDRELAARLIDHLRAEGIEMDLDDAPREMADFGGGYE